MMSRLMLNLHEAAGRVGDSDPSTFDGFTNTGILYERHTFDESYAMTAV